MSYINKKKIAMSPRVNIIENPTQIVQTTGDSETKVMSQKAVTDNFDNLEQNVTEQVNSVEQVITEHVDSILSAFDIDRHNLINPDETESGAYEVSNGMVIADADEQFIRVMKPIQIPSGTTEFYMSTDIPETDTISYNIRVYFATENDAFAGATIRGRGELPYNTEIPYSATKMYVFMYIQNYKPDNFCISFTEGFKKYNPIKTPVALKKEFLPSDFNPTTIVQETGDSETSVMSQKAVTDKFNSVTEQLNNIYPIAFETEVNSYNLINPDNITSGYYAVTDGPTLSKIESDTCVCTIIPVQIPSGVDTIYISRDKDFAAASSNIKHIRLIYLDGNDTVVWYDQTYDNSLPVNFAIPEEAVKFHISLLDLYEKDTAPEHHCVSFYPGGFKKYLPVNMPIKLKKEFLPDDPIDIVHETGDGETSVMSQKAVTESLNELYQSIPNPTTIVQETGDSETSVMSQKAVTENINDLEQAVTEQLTDILSAFDFHNLLDPNDVESGSYDRDLFSGKIAKYPSINEGATIRFIDPIQIPSHITNLYVSTDCDLSGETIGPGYIFPAIFVYCTNDDDDVLYSLSALVGLLELPTTLTVPDGCTKIYVYISTGDIGAQPENFCISVTEGFEKHEFASAKLNKEFLPSDLGVVNPTTPDGNLVKWDANENKMVDAETSLNFFTPERVAQKGQFLFINTEKGSEYMSEAMAGLVIPASGIYDGADENVQDGYAIVYDPKTKTLRLGTGQITHSRNIYTGEGEIDYKHFSFGLDDGYLFENETEDEAIATRADDFTEGHIPQWDSERNMFVDSGKSIDDIGGGGSGGYSATVDAIKNTLPLRDSGGGIKVGSKTGNINWAANIRTVEMAQSFNYVNYFPSAADENGEHSVTYDEARFAAVGWQNPSKVEQGILTGVPHSNVNDTWYQKVCNGSPNSKTLVVRDALVWGDKTLLSQMMNTFTDKVEDAWNAGNDLYIKVAPKCTIYIQSRIVNKGYSQIAIT